MSKVIALVLFVVSIMVPQTRQDMGQILNGSMELVFHLGQYFVNIIF